MFRKRFILLLIVVLLCGKLSAQDSTIVTPYFNFSYAAQIPGGDLAERFGWNSNVGAAFTIKNRNNWVMGVDGTFLFSDNINEDSILNMLKTKKGAIIDQNGDYARVFLYERGFSISVRGGKLFSFSSKNNNSGLLITAGVGFLQHKIRIEDIGNRAPQLKKEYKKGYDRLSNGWQVNEFVGYQHMGEKRLLSFFVGLECMQAFTQNRRDYNFDTMSKDTTQRLDLLFGLRVGWIIPFYSRISSGYYYY